MAKWASGDMGRTIGQRDTHHRMYQGKIRSTDSESYNLSNSGCKKATLFIREHYPLVEESSECLECPFERCLLDSHRWDSKWLN